MRANTELTGQRFGRLAVIGRLERDSSPKRQWRCVCDCGTEVFVTTSNLNSGNTKSCGCFRRDYLQSKASIPGGHNSRLYRTWSHMKGRCYNPSDKRFNSYGGRGIRVCEEWQTFLPFYNWAIEHGYKEHLTIERKDVNGDYSPNNCVWIPMSEQAKNRTNNHWVEAFGQKHIIAEWARITGIPASRIHNRLVSGWTPEQALSDKHGRMYK